MTKRFDNGILKVGLVMNEELKKFDHVINEFWSDPEHFVSFMNAYLFGGSRLIIIQCDKLNYVKIQQIMIMMK